MHFREVRVEDGRVEARVASEHEGAYFVVGGKAVEAAGGQLLAATEGESVEDLERCMVEEDPDQAPGVYTARPPLGLRISHGDHLGIRGGMGAENLVFKDPVEVRELVPPAAVAQAVE
jgi:hypothetical protein